MLNFTSARYLGLRHARGSLPDWDDLTTGVPAALDESPAALAVARRLAGLVGVGRATLGTSTLHLFWDLFGILAAGPLAVAVYADAATYPVACWGAERAAAAGVPVRIFAHHDPDHLRLWLRRDAVRERRPVVVADGFCPGCGRVAPLADYAAAARGRGGLLVIDDTQALGVLGRAPEAVPPYGAGGGGSLQALDTVGPGVVVVASLAKAFGAPLAALGGDATMVDRIEQQSETRVHCSPPSAAAVAAAARALAVNDALGDGLRRRLGALVGRFRDCLAGGGLVAVGGLFPVQAIEPRTGFDALVLHRDLRRRGIRAVLQDGGCRRRPRVALLITRRHRPEDVERAADAVLDASDEGASAPRAILRR